MIERERYAVVSCHVERLLDDRVWRLLLRLLEQAPGNFQLAALVRPPDPDADQGIERWLERARETASRSLLGHHTHWGGPATARPVSGKPEERVRHEGAWIRSVGLHPRVFCGGGWYLDTEVAETVADLGYIDCTATAFRPPYLAAGEPHVRVDRPCWLKLPSGRRLLELPTTHSLGMLARAVFRKAEPQEPLVHLYFHDTDLLIRHRVAALRASVALLARRRVPADLDRVASEASSEKLPVRHI
jgi:hypothetical protein